MAAEASARLKQLFAVSGIAALLFGKLSIEAVLPEVGRDRLYLLLSVGITHVRAAIVRSVGKTPEGWHLGARTKTLRISQPNRNPLLAQLQAHIFQVRPNLLLVLHQILRLQIQ